MVKTLATLFTGFGLFDVGAKAAGLSHAWGVEYDPALAAVATQNGFAALIADVRDVDYSIMPAPFHLHASPPCTTASVANASGGETELDGELSAAVVRAIRALRPRRFSLENVIGYRHYAAFHAILAALVDEGYALDWWHLNAADYGVPQTRRRLILVASLDHKPRKPQPTHRAPEDDAGQMTLFDPLPPWRGWLPALRGEYGGRDLLPELPETKLAAWQLKRMPEGWSTMLIAQGKYGDALVTSDCHAPSMAVTANSNQTGLRAVLVSNAATEYSDGTRDADAPALAVTSQHNGRLRAVLVSSNTSLGNPAGMAVYGGDAPAFSVVQSSTWGRAILVNEDSKMGTADSEAPSFTIVSSPRSGNVRAILGARVVRMTPRALARFQSVPDDYALPDKAGLAVKGIGNGVACLLARAIAEANP